MVRHLRWVVAIGLLIALAGNVTQAQITITASDVSLQLTPGSTLIQRTDSLTKSGNIGTANAASVWDFTGLVSSSALTATSVSIASTPYAAHFPGATNALRSTISVAKGVSGTGYVYLTVGTDLQTQGLEASNPPTGSLSYININTPWDITYKLPSTYGTSWTSVYAEQRKATLNLLGTVSTLFDDTLHYNLAYRVDGWGTLKVPGGYQQEALRIRRESRSGSSVTVTYIFLAPNGASVQAILANSSDSSGTVNFSMVSWTQPVSATGVQEAVGPVPTSFALSQNYPNPFNPSTTIEFSLPQRSVVLLKVFNMLGQEVSTLVNSTMEAGRKSVVFDAGSLPSGVYFYQLQTSASTLTKRMTLVR